MPYIDRQTREIFGKRPQQVGFTATTAGELNYCITVMLLAYLGSEPNYAKYNEVIGVLECAKLELYRRAVAKYEDGKAKANGDVFAEVEP